VVVKPWASIIIPTLSDHPPTLHYFDEVELAKMGVEIVVVKDLWRNASRARNIGAAASRGQVLCFIDDDVGLNPAELVQLLKEFQNTFKSFVWHDPPHILIVKKQDFLNAGGYDERLKPTMGETVELKLKLLSKGYQLISNRLKINHLNEPKPRYMLNQKHLTWAYLENRYLPLHKLIIRKNPIEVTRRIKWILEWVLIRKWNKRSIFYL